MKIKNDAHKRLEEFLDKNGKKIKKAHDKNKKLVLQSSHRKLTKKEPDGQPNRQNPKKVKDI